MDKQIEFEQKWMPWIKVSGAIVIVVLLALAGYFAYGSYQDSKATKAFADLHAADLLEQEAEKEADKNKSAALEVMLAWPENKRGEYESKLKEVIQRWPNTSAASSATFRLGRFLFAQKRYAEVESLYSEHIKSLGSSKRALFFKGIAYEGLGASLEAQGKLEEANKNFKQSADLKENPLKALALLGVARTERMLGREDEAKKTYEKLIQEFPSSTFERRARALMNYSPSAAL